MATNIPNIATSVRSCLYVINNTSATFEAQFIKMLSKTEAELKKSVAYIKKARFKKKKKKKLCGFFTVFIPIAFSLNPNTCGDMIIYRIKFFFVYII